MRFTRTLALGIGAATMLSLAACSEDKVDPQASASPSSAAPVATNTVEVSGVDYGYQITPTTPVKAGLAKITFKNDGKEAHMMAVAGIKAGKTLLDVTKALQSEDQADDAAAIDFEGGLKGAPSVLAPGDEQTTYTTLTAGNFALLCFVPVQAEVATKGAPHFVAGMVGSITVGAEISTDVAPATDGEVTLADGTITLPSGFGKGTYKVTNTGKAPHSLYFAKVKKADFPAVDAKVEKFFNGEPGVTAATDVYPVLGGGIDVLAPGQVGYVVVDLDAGTYTAICTESDDNDKSHSALPGESVEFTVA